MDPATQVIVSVTVPTMAVLVGVLYSNSRVSDLRSQMDARFDMLHRYLEARFDSVDSKFNEARSELRRVEEVMDARLKHLEERVK
ncbi:MAG: hypothetical protein SGI92_13955 [Bryobacteraceae bacterium]|nr:hypothetical protein [Bryobacteraceae bacterium]